MNPLLPEPSEEAIEMQQRYVKGLLNRLTQQPKAVKGACKRCGFSGHLTFQCMNHISIGETKKEGTSDDKKRYASSEESGEYKSEDELKLKIKVKKEKIGLKRSREESSPGEERDEKKKKKKSKKVKERKEGKRKHKASKKRM